MMISDFAKRQKAERAAASQFKAGTEVAIVSTHWERRIMSKRVVDKVYANGNFTLTNPAGRVPDSSQQYRPDYCGTTAKATGSLHRYGSDRVEVWTPAHDEELRKAVLDRRNGARRDRIIKHLEGIRRENLDSSVLAAVEAAIGITEPPVPETKP